MNTRRTGLVAACLAAGLLACGDDNEKVAPVMTGPALPGLETRSVLDVDPPSTSRTGDADDPAFWVHPTDPSQSLVITALKNGGLDVYDLGGNVVQEIAPDDIRFNNADVLHGFHLSGTPVDIAVASDRENDRLVIWTIDSETRRLANVTDEANPLIFTPPGEESNGETTAYGLALYESPSSGRVFAFVSQRESLNVAQVELLDNGDAGVGTNVVRTLTLPAPGEDIDPQAEGMVADQESGFVYIGQEEVGVWKFPAEPDAGAAGTLIDAVAPDGSHLQADVEGLTLYYASGGRGYLIVSSQGDSSFAVYRREGANAYVGSFEIAANGSIDSVQECDGAAVLNTPLGREFPSGLLVVQDGSNEPEVLVEDDGELENVNTNFKFVPWEEVARGFDPPLVIDTRSYDPRRP
jgi:myo-inositol-hexaphosphate 3-phosphohydrolase